LISLAAVTAPLHHHNHDTPHLNSSIFLPSFLGRFFFIKVNTGTAGVDTEMAGAAWFLQSGAH
jgi:hypothetical protein